MRRIRFTLVLSLFASLPAGLPGQCLYNVSTGYDNAGNGLLAEGAPDDQYLQSDDTGRGPSPALTGGPGNGFPIPPWLDNTARSLWVSSAANSIDLPAIYTYQITFTLTGDLLAEASLIGQWATDDGGLEIVINGVSTGVTSAGFGGYTAFPPNTGKGNFVAGENTIHFVLQNGGIDPNPTGLRVDACVGLEPPEDREVDISTGFDEAALTTLADDSPDSGYQVTGPGVAAQPAQVLNHQAFPIPPWLPATVQSKWIGLTAAGSNGAAGLYTYSTTVTMPDRFDPQVSFLQGRFASDDQVRDVRINGASTGIIGAGFAAYTTFPVDAGKGLFKRGANLIEFVVENGGEGPTGLRVDGEVVVGLKPPPAPECVYRISTGFDQDAGTVLVEGDVDDEYTVDNGLGAGPQPTFTGGPGVFPIPPWVANSDTSLWISSSAASTDLPGSYGYAITFNLPETVEAEKLVIIGRWATDDGGQDVIINGTPTGLTGGGFTLYTAFPPGAGAGLFQTGSNTIEFRILNAGVDPNPTGLRVDACVGLQSAQSRAFDLSTGFDEEVLAVFSNGAADDDYTLIGPAGSGIGPRPATVVNDNAFPIPPWAASNVQSKWIGAQANGGVDLPVGPYTYQVKVNLDAGLDVELTTISGNFAADGELSSIFVNGEDAGFSGAGFPFDTLTPLPGGVGRGLFKVGENLIDFVVNNSGDAANPTGFRFDGSLVVCPLPPGGAPQVRPSSFSLDTGFDDELGAAIADGQPDDNYEIIGPAGSEVCRSEAIVSFGAPIPPWLANNPQSKWIGTGIAGSNGPPGDYLFRIRVDLPPDLDAASARIIGQWTSDNNAKDILINGISTGITQGGNFPAYTPFPDAAGLGLFTPGLNTIEFVVFNAPPGVNPVGLRVEAVVGASPPNPADIRTGVSNRGIGLLALGATDDSYSVTLPGAPGAQRARVVKSPPGAWAANSGTSRWVGPDGDQAVGPAGQYLYEVRFPAPADQSPFRLSLKGSWTAAGRGADVLLNGVSLGLSAAGPGALVAFPAGAGLGRIRSGENVLAFVVENAAEGPTGLRVDAEFEATVAANPLDISTGFDESTGLTLNDFDLDDDYLVITDIENAATVLGLDAPIPPWVPNTGSSRWIGLQTVNINPGLYRYRIEVSLTADQASRARLAGAWAVDDQGIDILINDESTGIGNPGGYAGYTSFPVDAGLGLFGEGINSIEFQVQNGGVDFNPGGLRVDGVIDVGEVIGPKNTFRRGDADANTAIELTDPISLLNYLFLGGSKPECLDAADFDDNGDADISDAISNLNYQFLGGPPPAPPGPTNCGPDGLQEANDLGCDKGCG